MKKSQLRVSVFISGRTNNLFWFRQNILTLLLRRYQSWKNLSQKDYFLLGPPSWIIFHTKCSNCGWGSAWSTTYCTIGIKLPRSGWKIHTGSSLLSLLLGFLLGKISPSCASRANRTGAEAGSSAFRFPSGKWLVFWPDLRLRVEGFVRKLGLKFCRWVFLDQPLTDTSSINANILVVILIGIASQGREHNEEVIGNQLANHQVIVILVDFGLQRNTVVLHILEGLALQQKVDLVVVDIDNVGMVCPDERHFVAKF